MLWRYASECAAGQTATPGWVEVTSLGLGDYNAGSVNSESVAAAINPADTCWTSVRVYTSGLDNYELELPLPAALSRPDVTVLFTAAGFEPVEQRVSSLTVPLETYPGGTAPVEWLSPVYLAPTGAAESFVAGSVFSLLTAEQLYLNTNQALDVRLYAGMLDAAAARAASPLASVSTLPGGSFTFASGPTWPATAYTLAVSASSRSAAKGITVVENAFHVMGTDQSLELGVMLYAPGAAQSTYLVLRPETLPSSVQEVPDVLNRLHLHFPISGESNCGVFGSHQASPASDADIFGNPVCGQASLQLRMGYAAQAIEIASWAVPSQYAVFAAKHRRLCENFGMPSDESYPGGSDPTVNCRGDCTTGEGYCYAASETECANCNLYRDTMFSGEGRVPVCDPSLGFVPQGGSLYGTAEWAAAGCNSEAYESAAFNSQPSCSQLSPSRASVDMVSGTRVLKTVHLEPVPVSGGEDNRLYQRALCVETSHWDAPSLRTSTQKLFTAREFVRATGSPFEACDADDEPCSDGEPEAAIMFSSRPVAQSIADAADAIGGCAGWEGTDLVPGVWEHELLGANNGDAPATFCDAFLSFGDGMSSASACRTEPQLAAGQVVFSRVEYTFGEVAAALLLTGDAIKCIQVDGVEQAVPSASVTDLDLFASAPSAIQSRLGGRHRVEVIAAAATAPVLTLRHRLAPTAAPSAIGAQQLCAPAGSWALPM